MTPDQARVADRVAEAIPALARAGDKRAVQALLDLLSTREQVVAVLMILGERRGYRAQSPASDGAVAAHAEFNRLRDRGVPVDDMPVKVVLGEREYNAAMWRARRRKRQRDSRGADAA